MNPKALFIGFQKYYGVDKCLMTKLWGVVIQHRGVMIRSGLTVLTSPNDDKCFSFLSEDDMCKVEVTSTWWKGDKGIRVISHMKGIFVISHYIF